MSNAEEKQEQWIHYGFWIVAFALAIFAAFFFVNLLDNKFKPIPDGYRFSVTDHSTMNDKNWATYYIYDGYILVDKEVADDGSEASKAVIYDGIDTSTLELNEQDIAEFCDVDACYHYPKVIDTIKKMLVNKASREYTRL
ncbi:hypothetical protein IKF26_01300 [Candidatus Saccharibacteria bacterium]|nr:hypothetical protein [Candidatus Saccharibacteria bacterium]